MSRLSLRTKAEAPPEPVTDAHCEAALNAVQASEEPIAVTMAGSPPGGEDVVSEIEHAAPSPGPAQVATEERDPSQESGRAKRSVRRKSAAIIEAASDDEEAGVEDKPGEKGRSSWGSDQDFEAFSDDSADSDEDSDDGDSSENLSDEESPPPKAKGRGKAKAAAPAPKATKAAKPRASAGSAPAPRPSKTPRLEAGTPRRTSLASSGPKATPRAPVSLAGKENPAPGSDDSGARLGRKLPTPLASGLPAARQDKPLTPRLIQPGALRCPLAGMLRVPGLRRK
ncbi:hypothetical protein APUTEX25_005850 [Auxenochlorella protothecoides]|uniref:Uncharacterized protein n=1 Tax=Auxenochlorella protothecoides TaxID=3075 RepID=A0A3M7L0S9_AUXPR|nr:hypothetical protein APUTEX25_005850 [Auxenochlorella protothecoides]|eukprot:RMZ55809.1 hypothetical protein APUTEX25_005850 [Auxenochlorella protothecoides]